MTISYNWLCDYLPEKIEPEKLSKILTSIGLEVESLEKFESIKGGLRGLIIGEVLECVQHANADKLKVTKVNIGDNKTLQIVCGAANVAAVQKVVVAPAGTTIFPIGGEPATMKVAKIRGVESEGMICAEDEIGISNNHDGIIVLPATETPGKPAADFYNMYTDWIFEIGLTPNRMDAMSHLGVAKDVSAYMSHHFKKGYKVESPFAAAFKADNKKTSVKVVVENADACRRYSGVTIEGIKVAASPLWLQNKLKAIGVKPINNIVDITNFILHETGQPLHAFDADEIAGKTIIVKNLPEGTAFTTLDGKERKLQADDLMICDAKEGVCIAGVYGGLHSGIKEGTKNIFLESAWFHPAAIRKTSVLHNLRTDAASRFEKGVDISNTVNVLKRAALLIKEIAGAETIEEIVDVYPKPADRTQVRLKNHYLKKLSGKNYHADTVKKILESLGFEIVKEGLDELTVAAPFSKTDITLPADIVEEIIRIDGIDNIEIPASITIAPSYNELSQREKLLNKMSNFLTGLGFNEILTNSITNSKYYSEETIATSVKMLNSLNNDLNILRPSMKETALESIAWNMNRKNENLRFFEFGKTYSSKKAGEYNEQEHFCMYITGGVQEKSWKEKEKDADFFYAKGVAHALLQLCSITAYSIEKSDDDELEFLFKKGHTLLGKISTAGGASTASFGIRQPVYIVDFYFAALLGFAEKQKITYSEIPKFPAVERDLAFVADKNLVYSDIENCISKTGLQKLQSMRLFDIFENEKLGADKKSIAMKFIFLDEEKTLTDGETDQMMQKIMTALENELKAEIRKK